MDLIENGEPRAPRSNRRTAAWALVVVVAVAGLYGLRHMTESRSAPQTAPPTESAQTDDADPGVPVYTQAADATVPSEQMTKAMQTLPQESIKGGLVVVGMNFANGEESTGIQDDTMPGKGTYEVTVLCLGTGGLDVTLTDPAGGDLSPPIVRLVCTGRPVATSVKLSDGRLLITLNPDPETAAAFAYSVARVKA